MKRNGFEWQRSDLRTTGIAGTGIEVVGPRQGIHTRSVRDGSEGIGIMQAVGLRRGLFSFAVDAVRDGP